MSMFRRMLMMAQAMRSVLPVPIASYRAYDKTNDDEDRAVLKDLTGNGHDIQLYDFAFAEGSGYGKYAVDFTKWNKPSRAETTINHKKIQITKVNVAYLNFIEIIKYESVPSMTIKVTGLPTNTILIYTYSENPDGKGRYINISLDGIYKLPFSNMIYTGFQINKTLESCNITIEQIPDYQGALVSDGVDDYGFCENFPILTKEKGYTIVALRKWLDTNKSGLGLVSNINALNEEGAFLFEEKGIAGTNFSVRNFGSETDIQDYFNNDNIFTYLSSSEYNDKAISKCSKQGEPMLSIFKYYANLNNFYANAALYALEIYDRDLTDEEIAKVKARMIAEYEEKTGNKYEEETV